MAESSIAVIASWPSLRMAHDHYREPVVGDVTNQRSGAIRNGTSSAVAWRAARSVAAGRPADG